MTSSSIVKLWLWVVRAMLQQQQIAKHGQALNFATHAPALARDSGVCSAFRSTQCRLDLGHVQQTL